MTRVEKLEREVRELSEEELAQFRQWFYEYQEEVWDRQFEEDIFAGKFDALAEEALSEDREIPTIVSHRTSRKF